MNIEKKLFPEANELQIVGGEAKAKIIDAEIDPIDCEFHYDGCVHMDTKEYTYLTLTRENLETLIELIDESELFYSKQKP